MIIVNLNRQVGTAGRAQPKIFKPAGLACVSQITWQFAPNRGRIAVDQIEFSFVEIAKWSRAARTRALREHKTSELVVDGEVVVP
jgi:hypothetical protein